MLMGLNIGNYLLKNSDTDLLLAIVHFFIGLAMHAGINSAQEEDDDDF